MKIQDYKLNSEVLVKDLSRFLHWLTQKLFFFARVASHFEDEAQNLAQNEQCMSKDTFSQSGEGF